MLLTCCCVAARLIARTASSTPHHTITRHAPLCPVVTAITNDVPVVCLNVLGPNRYDYGEAATFMTHLDTELDRANPGASKLLQDHGVDIVHAAYLLANTIPNCISVSFDPHGSRSVGGSCVWKPTTARRLSSLAIIHPSIHPSSHCICLLTAALDTTTPRHALPRAAT